VAGPTVAPEGQQPRRFALALPPDVPAPDIEQEAAPVAGPTVAPEGQQPRQFALALPPDVPAHDIEQEAAGADPADSTGSLAPKLIAPLEASAEEVSPEQPAWWVILGSQVRPCVRDAYIKTGRRYQDLSRAAYWRNERTCRQPSRLHFPP
jgi:hypothetical protein